MTVDYLWILVAATALSAWVLASVVHAIASVYFGSLSHVPGPKLAAATTWWRAYVEAVKQVSWVDKLIELHSIYGIQQLLHHIDDAPCYFLRC